MLQSPPGKEQDAARETSDVGGTWEVTVRVPRTGCVVLSAHEGVAEPSERPEPTKSFLCGHPSRKSL